MEIMKMCVHVKSMEVEEKEGGSVGVKSDRIVLSGLCVLFVVD